MKKIYFFIVFIIIAGLLINSESNLQPRLHKTDTTGSTEIKNDNNPHNLPENLKKALKCTSCHSCEYPTKENPCLLNCPREDLVSVYHSPKEGPEVVFINEMSENYMGVVFSHRLHSEMAVMSTGCEGCHHFNTTGPVLNCRECHENKRARENVSIPDLKAAYHRQCLSCHKQWSGDNGCNTQCHLQKGSDIAERKEKVIESLKGKSHPLVPEPKKMIWETNYEQGKIVTFFHDEHYHLFKIDCKQCHQNDNCKECHGRKTTPDFSKPVKVHKTFEEHHEPCVKCHDGNTCNKCHRAAEMSPFNHGQSTGWTLKSYHARLDCSRCHGNSMPYRKLNSNCLSCHSNFKLGSFNHSVTGITLTGSHLEIECNSCHLNNDFTGKPQCASCHENDKSYPKDIPGRRGR